MSAILIRKSFEALRPRAQELVDTFYATLFERNPELKPLFAHVNLAVQKGMLLKALVLLVENVDKPNVLKPVLNQMGARHVGYGVKNEHYSAVGGSLLAALSKIAGPLWTADVALAWSETYQAVAGMMQEGAAVAVA